MDVRVLPPGMRNSRFERSMGEALRQQNETLEMQEVSDESGAARSHFYREKTSALSSLVDSHRIAPTLEYIYIDIILSQFNN